MQFVPGQVVRSTAGRDKGHLYVVVAVTAERILVADGCRRPRSRPKPKNPLHLHLVKGTTEIVTLKDEDIRQILRELEGAHTSGEKGREQTGGQAGCN